MAAFFVSAVDDTETARGIPLERVKTALQNAVPLFQMKHGC